MTRINNKVKPTNTISKKSFSSKIKVVKNTSAHDVQHHVEAVSNALSDVVTKLKNDLAGQLKTSAFPDMPELNENMLNTYSRDFNSDKYNTMRTNAISTMGADNLAENRSEIQQVNYAYSHSLDIAPRVTSQNYSGRCWLFAALNSMRIHLIRNFNLNDRFELSESYLFFYDKLERSYTYLMKMLEMRSKPYTDGLLNQLMRQASPICDGGDWTYVRNLILKYGIVPKTVYGESFNSSYTDEMNEILHNKLSQHVLWIRRNAHMSDDSINRKIIKVMMPEIYQLLANFMGEPPASSHEFDWKFNESGKNFESLRDRGVYHEIKGLTPISFYESFIKPYYNVSEMVHLRHDPRQSSEDYKCYMVEHSEHMVGSSQEIAFTVPLDVMKKLVATSVIDRQPVWFSCDVNKDFNQYHTLLSSEAYDYSSLFDQTIYLDKEEALITGVSAPTHAMLIVGLNTVNDDPTRVDKWKVENSWGAWGAEDPGYLHMTNGWFSRYVYGAVVNVNYLDPETRQKYEECRYDPIVFPYTDPFGAVANPVRTISKKSSSKTVGRPIDKMQS